jgi:hypothetical protein
MRGTALEIVQVIKGTFFFKDDPNIYKLYKSHRKNQQDATV